MFIHDDGLYEKGLLRLIARDGDGRSEPLVLNIVSTPLEVRMVLNTGIRLMHHAEMVISKE